MGAGDPLTHEPSSHRRSVSQLENFLRCPEGYRLEKIAKAPRAPAAWFAQGTGVHDSIERWESTGRIYSEVEAVQWFDTAWNQEIGKMLADEPDLNRWLTGGRTKADTDIKNREARGRQQVIDYIRWALASTEKWRILEYLPGEPAVEVPFDITLNSVRVIGYIDQIIEWRDGTVSPRDLKTGTKLPASPRQLGVYKIAIQDELDLYPEYGDYYMSKNNDVTSPHDLSRYTRERVAKWFEDLDAMVSQGRFIPNPGDTCRVCGVARFCDLLGPEAHLYPIEFTKS